MEHVERMAIEILTSAPRHSRMLNDWCQAIATDPTYMTWLLSGFTEEFPPLEPEAIGAKTEVAQAEQQATYALARSIVEYRLTAPGDRDGRNRDRELLSAIKYYHLAIVDLYQRCLPWRAHKPQLSKKEEQDMVTIIAVNHDTQTLLARTVDTDGASGTLVLPGKPTDQEIINAANDQLNAPDLDAAGTAPNYDGYAVEWSD